MKRHGKLWEQIVSCENIELAYMKAKKGKSKYSQVKEIESNPGKYLDELRQSLINGTFTTSQYKIKTIYEPKEREIYALPFYPDRIVQHAIMNIVAPIWEAMFINDSYACRIGKGQHKASQRLMSFIRKKYIYYFQGDIKKFYPSINHKILLQIIKHKIKDEKLILLFQDIIKSIGEETNVPIGNYTSQWFGNLYLNELDSFIKHVLKIKSYLRYNDDFILFGNDKEKLKIIQESVRDFLSSKLDLTLSKEKIREVQNGIEFIGYKHYPDHIIVRKSSVKRMRKNIKIKHYKFVKNKITPSQFISTLQSICGWLKWANTYNLKQQLNISNLLQEAENAKLS